MNKNTRWLYLMSKYTGRELDSLKENQDAWLTLNQKGYFVYSPICETHNVEEYRYHKYECGCKPIEDGCGPCEECEFKREIEQPDYVARDLALIEALLKHDYEVYTEYCRCSGWHKYQMGSMPCGAADESGCKIDGYDSGVVGVVLPSAMDSINFYVAHGDLKLTIDLIREGKMNYSIGAIREYDFCKSKHLLVISLETALTIPPEQWEEYGL